MEGITPEEMSEAWGETPTPASPTTPTSAPSPTTTTTTTTTTHAPQQGGGVLSDILQGIGELPRAAVHGAGEAVNQTLQAIDSGGDWLNQHGPAWMAKTPVLFNEQGQFSPGLRDARPEDGPGQIPNVSAPKSTTGKIEASIFQFIAGMVGAGKLTKLKGLTGAFVNGALTDAFAFDPHMQRLSNVIEAVPALQNPISEYLKAKPEDGAAEGRLKNAIEGLAVGGALTGVLHLGIKALRARRAGNSAEAEALEEQMGQAPKADPAAPNAAAEPSVTLYHGSPNPSLTLDQIQIVGREGAKQGKKGRTYGGFYASGEDGLEDASRYAKMSGGEGTIYEVNLKPGTKILDLERNGEIERLSAERINDLVSQGYGAVRGKNITGKQTEYAVIDKEAIEGLKPRDGSSTPATPGRVEQVGTKEQEVAQSSMPLVKTDADLRATLRTGIATDTEAVLKHGSVEKAEEAGHVFAKDENLFDFTHVESADDFTRVISDVTAEAVQKQASRLRGGNAEGVQTWEGVQGQVRRLGEQFGADPETFLGTLHVDARDAKLAAAKVVAYERGVRGLNDKLATLAQAYVKGEPGAYGSMEALGDALEHHAALMADISSSTKAIITNHARALNAMKLARKAPSAEWLSGQNTEDLARAIITQGGELGGTAKAAQRHFAATAMEKVANYYTANLLWSPYTHFRNLVGNALMLPTSPLTKILGGTLTANRGLALEGAAQGVFLATVMGDAFRAAGKAWRLGRPMLDPGNVRFEHNVEVSNHLIDGKMGFENAQQIGTLLLNKAWQVQQAPFRALGAADEFFKQLVAGSAVKAEAFRAAIEKNGFGQIWRDPDELHAFIAKSYDEAYDPVTGALVNTKALDEARLATFTAEYEKGSWQENLAKFVAKAPVLRIIGLPFLKTPMNLWKQSFRWTPFLNFAVEDVRRKWAMGGEERAKIIGEMGLGTLLWGGAFTAISEGKVTGGGPSDPKALRKLEATGWRKYSYVWTNSDGSKTYVPMGQFDPFGLILGTAADLFQAGSDIANDRLDTLDDAASALFLALIHNARDKNYFEGLTKTIDALSEDGGLDKLKRFVSDTIQGFVPGATGWRALNDDPHMRDARTIVDRLRASFPGDHEGIAKRYNAFGEPIERQNPIYSVQKGDPLTAEVQQAAEMMGKLMDPVPPRIKAKQADAWIDLRKITLKDGSNAYDTYMDLVRDPSGRPGHTLREEIEKLIAKPAFQRLDDGSPTDKGSKMAAIAAIRRKYAEAAKKKLMQQHPEVLQELENAKGKHRTYIENSRKYRELYDQITTNEEEQ